MAVAISTLLPDVRMEVANVPEPVLVATLYRVLRQFYWESELSRYTFDNGLDLTSGSRNVPAGVAGTDYPANHIVKRIDRILYSASGADWDKEIDFKTRDELDRINSNWRTKTGSTPRYWTYDNEGQAVVTPVPDATVSTALLIRAVVAPVFSATSATIPDLHYYEFEETIKAGILAQLYAQPGKDWSDPRSATFYGNAFAAGVIKAKSRAESDFGQPKDSMAYGGL